MRAPTLILLAVLIAPGAALAIPELPVIPNLGQSGQDVTLPDVVGEHYPPELPAGPSGVATLEIPVPSAAGGPPAGAPPDPITPAGRDAHPLGGAPPFGVGNTPSVPEPGIQLLLAAGLAGLFFAGRRRQS